VPASTPAPLATPAPTPDVSAAPPAAIAPAPSAAVAAAPALAPIPAPVSAPDTPPATVPDPALAAAAEAPAPPPPVPHVDDLAGALALRAPGATAAAALAGALEAWSLDGAAGAAPPPLALPDLLAALEAHGLGVLELPAADLDTLRAIAHPALLVVAASDGAPRALLLRRIDGEEVELVGVAERGPVRVPASALEGAWSGESYVVWREYEALPPVLREGDRGDGVSWLQGALSELGFSPGAAAGLFDQDTELAVRAFQADHQLVPDGQVGPLTKMSLYRALGRYAAPDVVAHVQTGGAG